MQTNMRKAYTSLKNIRHEEKKKRERIWTLHSRTYNIIHGPKS